MKVRVLIPLMVAGAIAVIAILIPAAATYAANRTQALLLSRSASLHHIVQLAELAMSSRDTDALDRYLGSFTDTYRESVLVITAGGRLLASSGSLDENDSQVRELVGSATRNLPQLVIPDIRPWSGPLALIAQPVHSSGETVIGAVVLQVDQTRARTDVTIFWLLIVAAGVVLLAALAFAALRLTHWVLLPVKVLDAAANRFPSQHFTPELSTGPPELRQLAESFARMATGVERTMSQQRDFVADASHQLRNPLAAIRLRLDGFTPDQQIPSDQLDVVNADLDRLESTVDNMLELATAEHRATVSVSGTPDDDVPVHRSYTVPSVAMLAEPFRELIAAADQKLVPYGDDNIVLPCTNTDLTDIIGSLLDNARKYAGRGATVRLGLTRTAHGIALTVSDNGPGLSDAELHSVGRRFWRSAGHRSEPGTGLGLAIVEQLATANGARMTVARADEGGLAVSVLFPRETL